MQEGFSEQDSRLGLGEWICELGWYILMLAQKIEACIRPKHLLDELFFWIPAVVGQGFGCRPSCGVNFAIFVRDSVLSAYVAVLGLGPFRSRCLGFMPWQVGCKHLPGLLAPYSAVDPTLYLQA